MNLKIISVFVLFLLVSCSTVTETPSTIDKSSDSQVADESGKSEETVVLGTAEKSTSADDAMQKAKSPASTTSETFANENSKDEDFCVDLLSDAELDVVYAQEKLDEQKEKLEKLESSNADSYLIDEQKYDVEQWTEKLNRFTSDFDEVKESCK